MRCVCVFANVLLVLVTAIPALHAEDWIAVTAPGELRSLLSGKTLGNGEYLDFYRSDGAMAYFNRHHDTTVVRRWQVADDGTVCTYIYAKPEKLVECVQYFRSSDDPSRLRMDLDKGISMYGTLSSAPPPDHVFDVIVKTAGPAN